MAVQITCACGKQLLVPERLAGKRARCKECGHIVEVPTQEVAREPFKFREEADKKPDAMTPRPVDASPETLKHIQNYLVGMDSKPPLPQKSKGFGIDPGSALAVAGVLLTNPVIGVLAGAHAVNHPALRPESEEANQAAARWANTPAGQGYAYLSERGYPVESRPSLLRLVPALLKKDIGQLEKLLQDEDRDLRTGAAAALGDLGQPTEEIVPLLIEAFEQDKDLKVRARCAIEMARVAPTSRAVQRSLLSALQDDLANHRLAVLRAIEIIGPPMARAVPQLQAVLQDPKCGSVRHVVQALAAIGPAAKAAVPALRERLQTAEKWFRPFIKAAIQRINGEHG